MKIYITSGVGTGETTLSAFDTALKDAGVYNYNLIKLSSVIPPKSEIIIGKPEQKEEEFGQKLYVVCAEERSDLLGHSVAAGVGWYQWTDNRGVFAEHHEIVDVLDSKVAEQNVTKKIETTVKDLCNNRDQTFNINSLRKVVTSAEVTSKPTCVLVIAVYESEHFKP